ncbi:hypothetical protein PRZ48_014496 [Zasmidium cellare]|uniref:RRM domain-containing protein n=1 Tax=Zasmidium cellare TaxID=395010 RepID=A0ABR0DYX7_ZASCE|nr:hypothetical protein PRZ48_014496 [Zasmidium cellare]
MSSGKLDQSLDEIMKDSNTTGGRGQRRGRNGRLPNRRAAAKAKAATTAVVAPSGGIQKKTKAPKPAKAPAAAVAPQLTGESKVSVSNLPGDVDQNMIKDFFTSSVGPVKRVLVNYGPDGRSRGSATVIFHKANAAALAVKHDGTKVDGRNMKVEVLLGANSIPAPQPPKSLADRVQPKNAAKEQQKKKQKDVPAKATTNGAAKTNKPKKSGRAGRPKKKTAEELDAEMQDYFGSGEAPAATNGAPAANGGDTGMEEVV